MITDEMTPQELERLYGYLLRSAAYFLPRDHKDDAGDVVQTVLLQALKQESIRDFAGWCKVVVVLTSKRWLKKNPTYKHGESLDETGEDSRQGLLPKVYQPQQDERLERLERAVGELSERWRKAYHDLVERDYKSASKREINEGHRVKKELYKVIHGED